MRPTRVARLATELATRIAAHEIEAVCGPLVGGAFLAEMIASCLDVEFFYTEPSARPGGGGCTRSTTGCPPLFEVRFAVSPSRSSTMSSTPPRRLERFEDLRACSARTVAIGALLTLGSAAAAFADEEDLALERLAALPNTLWEPPDCRLCPAGMPLATPAG